MLEDLIHKTIQDHYEELIEFPGFTKQLMQIIQQPEAVTTFNQEDWKIAATLLAVKYSRHNNLDFNETFLEQKLLETPQRHAFLILQTFLDIFEKHNKITESRYSYISSKREPTYIENFIKNKDITLSQDATKSILIQLNNTYKTDSVFALVINSKGFSDQNIMDILLSDDNLKFDIVDKIIKYKTSISNPIQQEIIQVILEQQNSVHDFHDKQNLNKLLTSILQNKSFDDSLIELLMTKSGLHYIRQYSSKTLQDIFASHNFSFECLKQIISANSNTINFVIQTQKLTDQQFQIMLDKYPQFWHEAVTNTNISQKLALKFFNDTIQKPHLLGALLKVNGEKIPNKLLLDTASSLMQNTTFNVATTTICLHLIEHNNNNQQLFDKIYPIIKTIDNPPTMAHLFLNNNTTTEQRKTIIKEYRSQTTSKCMQAGFGDW